MNFSQFRRILLQVFFVPLVVLGIAASAVYLQLLNANRVFDLIRRSDLRIAQISLTAKLIVDEETALRGFEGTGDPRFLDPYRGTETRVHDLLHSLENVPGSIGPDGKPNHGIVELEQAYGAWHTTYADPMLVTVRRGEYIPDHARELAGKALMDRVRLEADAVLARAERRRAERIALWQHQNRLTEIALFALTLGTGLLIGLFSRDRLHAVSAAYRQSLATLEQRNEQSFQSEQKLLTTLASIGDGVIACDTRGRVEMMNRVAEQLTGWPLAEARGREIAEIFPLLNEASRAPLEDPMRRLKRGDGTNDRDNHALLVQRHGSELPVADSGAPIRAQDGSMQGVVVVFRDVSAERRTQEALLAQERLASSGRLAATIAHEIHNPLHHVGDLLYLMRDGSSPEEISQFLKMASVELERVTEISRAMLGLHRESTEPIALDLREIIHDVLLLLKRQVFDLGVTIEADLPAGIIIQGYPGELKQVFTNLICNALEATGKGGEVLVRVLRTQIADNSGDGVEIQVRDNGPGISAAVLATLFKPFVTTKGEHGTGLGLWVSRGIVAKHGGTLVLESDTEAKAHGTLARITLPSSAAGTPPLSPAI